MPLRVILLNGASSSGKSTLAKSLQKYIKDNRKEKYIITSIDEFLNMSLFMKMMFLKYRLCFAKKH